MADTPMPPEVRLWMRARHWGDHHLEWHVVRQWDRMSPAARAAATARGWQRHGIQEGAAGNGVEFLAMHRAMIELLGAEFPAHAALFDGWAAVPVDPADSADPVPPTSDPAFNPNMLAAVDALQTAPESVGATDDEFGLFVETAARPLPGQPAHRSDDPRTGIHNYLHNRFSDAASPVNMGSPAVNIENAQFWRLHGWIDARWSASRAARGLPPEDAALRAAVDAAKAHMSGTHHDGGLESLPAAPVVDDLPRSVREPFARTLAGDFEALSQEAPYPRTVDELKEYLQIAARLELATLPLYLTAQWSLKSGDQRGLIAGVALEEMLHLGLVCNLLVALGGKPDFATADTVIRFPDVLPGIEATAPFALEAFSVDQVRRFMEIELPAHDPIPDGLEAVPTFRTIGDFYIAVEQGLGLLNPPPTFATDGQLERSFSNGQELTVVHDVAEALEALQLIRKQGEGTPQSQGSAADELAHYYQFNQMVRQQYYTHQTDGTWKLDPAKPLPLPAAGQVWPMARVPAGGYPDVPEAVAFDQLYSDMLRALQAAWTGGGAAALKTAIKLMYALEPAAQTLMEKPRGSQYGPGNYGPAYRFVPPAEGGTG